MHQIANFHNDLLSYLAHNRARTAYDPESRASIPLLRQGGVVLETLAIFEQTRPGSRQRGETQFQIFKTLPTTYPNDFGKAIRTILAIENAATFCDEEEPLEHGLERLEKWHKEAGQIAYISLTWNHENRFGGGCGSKVGLKRDGEKLLQWMSGKNIAVDLSHTSDPLAHDILNFIDKHHLLITPVASHSNFREIAPVPRNLPDPIAKEIKKRGGLIGLNFFRHFLGTKGPEDLLAHVHHAFHIDVISNLCFGADFFDDRDLPLDHYPRPLFLPELDNASCYPKALELLKEQCSETQLAGIAYNTLAKFLKVRGV